MIPNKFRYSGCKLKGYAHQLIRPFRVVDDRHVNTKTLNMDREMPSYQNEELLLQKRFLITIVILV